MLNDGVGRELWWGFIERSFVVVDDCGRVRRFGFGTNLLLCRILFFSFSCLRVAFFFFGRKGRWLASFGCVDALTL